jgi:UDP-GlcNAc:undecaprenyl-phosphate/decaprenyl-phosphate GlcNAc-1-phosphate transferase
VAFLLTPLVRNAARARGWVDHPDGRRKRHVTAVPRLGGVAIFWAFALSCATLVVLEVLDVLESGISVSASLQLLASCGAVALVGVIDDIYDVRPIVKLLVQSVAAVHLYASGYQINGISNPLTGESVPLGPLSIPLTVLWFVGMSNAFNLIDGLDGLAAGVGLFSTTTLFIACVINERWAMAIIAAALAGALLGFLRYNFNPASIFLGDSGSLFVGFALAAIAVRGSMKSSAAIAVAAPLLALAVPIIDAGIAVFRRLVRGNDVFGADGDHVHHRLLRMGLTPRGVVGTLYAVAALFGALSLLTMTVRGQVVGMVVIASSIVTWIGIQQLGYAEFAEIQRSLRYGFVKERRSIGNNVYLASLTQRFAEAADFADLRAILIEAMVRLEFERLEIRFVEGCGELRSWFPTWQSEAPSSLPTEASSVWTVPVVEGQLAATIVLTRSLQKQAQFEPVYFLQAIQRGLAARLGTLMASRAPLAEERGERHPAAADQPRAG